jgi:hypothetical protein
MSSRLSTGDGIHGFPASLQLTLPPLAAVFYRQAGG